MLFRRCPDQYDADLALDYAWKAVEDNPRLAWRQVGYGWVLYRQGRLREAREALLRATELQIPKPWPWGLFGLAMTEWKLGNRSEAREYYARAVARMEQTYPRFPEFILLKEETAELLGIQP